MIPAAVATGLSTVIVRGYHGLSWAQLSLASGDSAAALTSGRGEDWRLESQWPFASGWAWVGAVGLGVLLTWLLLSGTISRRSRPVAGRAVGGIGSGWGRPLVLWGLRLLVVALLWVMVGGWQIVRYETDLPDLVMLVDTSQSMQLAAGETEATAGGASRWQRVVELLTQSDGELLRRLSEQYRLRLHAVGAQREVLPTEIPAAIDWLRERTPDGEVSRLGDHVAAVAAAQRGRSTAALVLLSDGITTAGSDLAAAAEQLSAQRLPLIAAHVGSTRPPPQLLISELIAESTAMVGDEVNVVARLRWQSRGGQSIDVRLVDSETGRVIDRQTLAPDVGASEAGDGAVELSFVARQAGLRRMQVEAEPLRGELATEDNLATVTVDVRDESFRVLLIQGGPSYEFRFLKHLLERATSQDGSRRLVQLTSVLQRGDPRYAEQDRTAEALPPVDAATLEELDIVILSDCDPAALGSVLQERLAELVSERGVSLVVLGGPDHLPGALRGTPLAKLLPLDPATVRPPASAATPLRWRLTPLGESLPNLQMDGEAALAWREAPPLYWLMESGPLRPGARVLIEATAVATGGPPRPVVVSQLVGSGQVWLHLTDEFFRLNDEPLRSDMYERYWLQLVRRLARRRVAEDAEAASLDVLGERFRTETSIPFAVRLGSVMKAAAEGSVEITVADDEGERRTFSATPDLRGEAFRGVIEGLAAGAYRAVLTRPVGSADPPSDTFVVLPAAQELRDSVVDLQQLNAISRSTGGAAVAVRDGAAALLAQLPPGRAMRIRPLPPLPIWNHWAVASLLFGLLSTEWILRRRWNAL